MGRRYSSELDRLRTFTPWTSEVVAKEDLAKAGFWYVGPGDTVKCFRCKVEIGEWQPGDNPEREHLKHSPDCPFARKLTVENAQYSEPQQTSVESSEDPIDNMYRQLYKKYLFADARSLLEKRWARYRELQPSTSSKGESAAAAQAQGGTAITGTTTLTNVSSTSETSHREEINRPTQEANITQSQISQNATEYCIDLKTITSVAKHPEYSSIEARMQSYSSWPNADVQEPKVLAEAGFYFTGRDDRVRCFACDGGLCNWAQEDVPWYEHSKWYGSCPYVQDCKRHPVVSAIIDTARTFDNEQSHISCHHHYHQGETQCDPGHINQRESENSTASTNITSEDAHEHTEEHKKEEAKQFQAAAMVEEPSSEITEDLKSLQHENEQMKSARTCKLCMDSPVGVIFLPCSHLVCCLECGLQLNTCPLCRGDIKATAKVYV